MKILLMLPLLLMFFNTPEPLPVNDSVADTTSLEVARQAVELKPIAQGAFKDGEELSFKIRYGFIKAGTAKMKVFEKNGEDGKRLYHLQTTARSLKAFDWIYKVEDVVNSFVDYTYFYPVRFEKKLREGGYKADLFTDYVHDDSLAVVEFIRYHDDMKVRKRQKYEVKIPPYVQDILSSLYYVRTQELEVGQPVYITNHEKKKIYDMEVLVHRREIIEVEAGKFMCIVVEPVVRGEGLFKKEGSLQVWLTDDDRKIPVQMQSEIVVGHITSELVEIRGVDGRITAKIK